MTIKEFVKILKNFDQNKDIFVALFKRNGIAEMFDIIALRDNNGHIQIDIKEDKEDDDFEYYMESKLNKLNN